MAKFTLGTYIFPSKQTAIDRTRTILWRSPIALPLAGDDGLFIRTVLDHHPHVAEKTARGVSGIAPMVNTHHGSNARGFHVLCPDGPPSISFSYQDSFGMNKDKPNKAARSAIEPSRLAFKLAKFAAETHIPCPVTGRLLTFGDCHVDHYPTPFATIYREFIEAHGVPETIDVSIPHADGLGSSNHTEFVDPSVAALFRSFHDQRATLRLVAPEVNLRNSGTGKIR